MNPTEDSETIDPKLIFYKEDVYYQIVQVSLSLSMIIEMDIYSFWKSMGLLINLTERLHTHPWALWFEVGKQYFPEKGCRMQSYGGINGSGYRWETTGEPFYVGTHAGTFTVTIRRMGQTTFSKTCCHGMPMACGTAYSFQKSHWVILLEPMLYTLRIQLEQLSTLCACMFTYAAAHACVCISARRSQRQTRVSLLTLHFMYWGRVSR